MLEIRWHGRGGQGAVTSVELLALSAIEEGFRRAWPSIRDSNITTMISSIVLYYFTSSFVQGFALALFIGVVMSMFSAITVTRTLLRVFTVPKT